MRELIKCLFLAVVVAMAVGCESDDDPFAPDKNEVYGYEFDCGLAQHVDNQEQTIVVNESTVEGVPEEDSEWNMVRNIGLCRPQWEQEVCVLRLQRKHRNLSL